MAISNYNELVSAVGTWSHRDDLTGQIPDFISLAESYINEDLRDRSMITEATLTAASGVAALPDGFLECVSLRDSNNRELDQLQHEKLKYITQTSGAYEYYSITNQVNFSSTTGSYTMTYYKKLNIATDSTNDVLTNYPHVYLYGALIQAEPYLKNEKRIDVWHAMYENAIRKINKNAKKSKTKLRTNHPSRRSYFNGIRDY